ncbi:MAG TPA: Hsp33 family molecular chaperone HslO [Gallionella sp.]|nr:Hsp33 family molecular chaperone HslO [Gallionella sp.]
MKTQPDSLHRFLFENAPIRGERVHLDASWRSVLEHHDYPPLLRQMMGELIAAAVLLAATLKLDGSLVLQIQGRGAIKLLVVECDGDLQLRATAKWEGPLHGSLSELVGDGRFVITLDPKDGKQAYQGIVALEGESVAEILQNYMTRSEQLETRLWLAADEHAAAGMLLQKLPEQSESDADAWSRVTQLADTLHGDELMQLPTQELLHRLYHEEDVRLFEAQPVSFHCTCSRDNVAQMLRMLGADEVESILDERETVEVHCEFCNHRYEFDRVDAAQLFAGTVSVAASETLH